MNKEKCSAISDAIRDFAYEVNDRVTRYNVITLIKGIIKSRNIICDESNNMLETLNQCWLICDVDDYRFTLKASNKLLRPGLPLLEPIVEVEKRK